jgi:hypothetical protein
VFAFFLSEFDNIYSNIYVILEIRLPFLLNAPDALTVTNKPYVVIMISDK